MFDPWEWLKDRAEDAEEDLGGFFRNAVSSVESVFQGVGDVVSKVGSGLEKVISGVMNDPLPVIASIGLTAIGVPPQVVALIKGAAQGGNMDQMVFNMATSYIGGQLGAATGDIAFPELGDVAGYGGFGDVVFEPTATDAIFKSVLTNASGNAATALFQGKDDQAILTSALNGAVSGLIKTSLRTEYGMDPAKLGDKFIMDAATAATKGIFNGKYDPATALGEAIGNTALAATTKLAASDFKSTISTLKTTADNFDATYTEADELKTSLKTQWDDLTDLQTTANGFVDEYNELQDRMSSAVSAVDDVKASLLFSKVYPDFYKDNWLNLDISGWNKVVDKLDLVKIDDNKSPIYWASKQDVTYTSPDWSQGWAAIVGKPTVYIKDPDTDQWALKVISLAPDAIKVSVPVGGAVGSSRYASDDGTSITKLLNREIDFVNSNASQLDPTVEGSLANKAQAAIQEFTTANNTYKADATAYNGLITQLYGEDGNGGLNKDLTDLLTTRDEQLSRLSENVANLTGKAGELIQETAQDIADEALSLIDKNTGSSDEIAETEIDKEELLGTPSSETGAVTPVVDPLVQEVIGRGGSASDLLARLRQRVGRPEPVLEYAAASMSDVPAKDISISALPETMRPREGETVTDATYGPEGEVRVTMVGTRPDGTGYSYTAVQDPEDQSVFYETSGGGEAGGSTRISDARPEVITEAEPSDSKADTEKDSTLDIIKEDAGTTEEDIEAIVRELFAENPSLSKADVVDTVEELLKGLPDAPTLEEITKIVNEGTSDFATKSQIEGIVEKAIKDNPGLTKEQVTEIVGGQLDQLDIPSDIDITKIVNDSIAEADLAKKADVTDAISNALAGLDFADKKDVEDAIDAALKANPSITEEQITEIISGHLDQFDIPSDVDIAKIVNDSIAEADLAKKADVTDAISTALAGLDFADEKDIEDAIDAALKANPSLTTTQVTELVNTALKDNNVATDTDVSKLAKDIADVQSQISGLGLDYADKLSKAVGDITDTVDEFAAAGATRDEALDAAIKKVASNLGLAKDDLLEQLGETETTLSDKIAEAGKTFAADLDVLQTNLTERIKTFEDAGFTRDEAIKQSITDLADELGDTEEGLLAKLGTTESQLKSEISDVESRLGEKITGAGEAYQSQLNTAVTNITGRINEFEALGATRDEALSAAIASVADDLGLAKDDLLAQLGETESSLAGRIAKSEQAFTERVGTLQTDLIGRITAFENAGLTRDQAIKASVDELADELGDTTEGLLTKLGTTESNLKTQLESGLAGVTTQFGQELGGLKTDLLSRIQAFEDAGLTRDQATQASLTELADELGDTEAGLLEKLGTTETQLKSEIGGLETRLGTQIGDLQSQITGQGLEYATKLSTAVDTINDRMTEFEGLGATRDEALQAAIDSLADELGTTSQSLLDQLNLNKTELQDRIEQANLDYAKQVAGLTTDISGVKTGLETLGTKVGEQVTGLGTKVSGIEQTLAQQPGQWAKLFSDLQKGFGTQISGLQSQLARQNAAQQAAQEQARKEANAPKFETFYANIPGWKPFDLKEFSSEFYDQE